MGLISRVSSRTYRYIMNIDRLENDLNNLIKSGKDYYVRDAAKKRAVEQRVPSYEHFEQIVKGAHLKPLSKNDQIGGQSTQKWNKPAEEATFKIQHNNASTQNIDTTDLLEVWKNTKIPKLQFLLNTDEEPRRVFLSTVLERHVDFLEELAVEIEKNEDHEYVSSGTARVDLQTLQKNASQYELAIAFLDDENLENSLKRLLN